MKQHYQAARRLQQAGEVTQAAAEYGTFLAEALHRLANGRAKAGQFDRASALYEEALRLAPEDLTLYLDYEKVCLDSDQLIKARSPGEKAVQLGPRNPRARFLLGRILFNLEDYQAAKSQLEAAVALNPDFDAGYLLGKTYLLLHDEKLARSLFNDMMTGLGDTALIHIYFGRAYSQNDYPDPAIEEFHKAIEIDSQAPDAHYYLALTYLGHNEEAGFAKAIPEFRAELKINPNDFRSEYMLGYIARKQRSFPEAERELTRAVALNPVDLDALLELAGIFADTDRTTEAEATLRKTMALAQLTPGNERQLSRAHYLLGQILRRVNRSGEAKRELAVSAELERQSASNRAVSADERSVGSGNLVRKEAADQTNQSRKVTVPFEDEKNLEEFSSSLSPLIAEVYNDLGAIAASQEDFLPAMEDFQKASAWNPSLQGLDRNLGLAAFYAGHYTQAAGPLAHYLDSHPADAVVRSAAGISLFRTGEFAKVAEILQPIEAALNERPELSLALAVALVKTGRSGQGIERLKTLENANPQSMEIHKALAEAYYEQGTHDLELGNLEAAVSNLEMAAKLEPENGFIHYQLAEAYRRGKRDSDAEREMNLYRALNKQDSRSGLPPPD